MAKDRSFGFGCSQSTVGPAVQDHHLATTTWSEAGASSAGIGWPGVCRVCSAHGTRSPGQAHPAEAADPTEVVSRELSRRLGPGAEGPRRWV